MDDLTGLANHREAREWLKDRCEQADLRSEVLSIAVLDVDDMRGINAAHGHALGDVVLLGLADLMRSAIGASGLAARVGGEDFLLAWLGDGALEAAREVDALRVRFYESEFELEDGERVGGFTLSAGVTELAGLGQHQFAGDIVEALLLNANRALSEARDNGGNCVRIF